MTALHRPPGDRVDRGGAAAPADLFGSRRSRAATGGWPGSRTRTHARRRSRQRGAFAKLAGLWQQHRTRRSPLPAPAARFARGDLANLYHGTRRPAQARAGPGGQRPDGPRVGRDAYGSRGSVEPALAAYFPRLLEAQRVHDPRTGAERRGNRDRRARRLRQPGRGAAPRSRWARSARRRVDVAAAAGRDRSRAPRRRHPRRRPARARADPSGRARPRARRLVLLEPASGSRSPRSSPGTRDWYPPEADARRPRRGPTPTSASPPHCMTELIGDRMPAPLARLRPRLHARQRWRAAQTTPGSCSPSSTTCSERLYGPRKFRPFVIPA